MHNKIRPLRIFLSSTLEDLGEYRKALIADLEHSFPDKLHICNAEDWAAKGRPPLDVCLKYVEDCDLVLAIVAGRYGSTPPEKEQSFTELECRHARDEKIAILPLFVDKKNFPYQDLTRDAADLEEAAENKNTAEVRRLEDSIAKLKAFRDWLGDLHHGASFKDQESLLQEARRAVFEWWEEHFLTAKPASNEQASPTDEASPAFDESAYKSWLIERCDLTTSLGAAPAEKQVRRIRDMYVPALAPRPAEEGEERRRGAFLEDDEHFVPLLSRLGEESLYVSGSAGTGKSVFCRWAALVTALGAIPRHPVALDSGSDFVESLPEQLAGKVPVLLRLRDAANLYLELPASGTRGYLWEGNGNWTAGRLEQALAAWVDHERIENLNGAAMLDLLRRGRCLLILDGLDELPTDYEDERPRHNLRSGILAARKTWHENGNRLLLTGRPNALSAEEERDLGVQALALQVLPEELQTLFVRRWYRQVAGDGGENRAGAMMTELQNHPQPDLHEMRANPNLLGALCLIHRSGKPLPIDRYALYASIVDNVLDRRYDKAGKRANILELLEHLALEMHTAGRKTGNRVPRLTLEVGEAIAILDKHPRVSDNADVLCEELADKSGLLKETGEGELEFYHRGFQEYLAARRVYNQWQRDDRDVARWFRDYAGEPQWRDTLRFLFGALAAYAERLALEVCESELLPCLEPERLAGNHAPALLLGDCLASARARGLGIENFQAAFMRGCESSLEIDFDAKARAELWQAAGSLGFDRRPGVRLDQAGLPDIVWCEVTPYPGEPEIEIKKPDFHFPPGEFLIAKYPVTNAQFQAFVDDEAGYAKRDWWHPVWLESGKWKPDEIGEGHWPEPNAPRESVNWFEAMAFCKWLTAKQAGAGYLRGGQRVIRLPTEWEWQQAARRPREGTWHPWAWESPAGKGEGEQFDTRRANTDEGGVGRTTAVGLYPLGASPADTLDMCGNVWEWCLNEYDQPGQLAIDLKDDWRVLRGGSWFGSLVDARVAARSRNPAFSRFILVGFRVCVSSPIAED